VELILYAEPTGSLGARCAEYWAAVSAADATTSAQEYPPHVTLTGFFHRSESRLADVLAAFQAAVDVAVPAGLDGSRWAGPVALEYQANDTWIGLHVQAEWIDAVIAAFTDAHRELDGEDPVRPKAWLNLSLSYGEQYEWAREQAAELAAGFAEVTTEAEWSVSLWHRHESAWDRLATVAVRCT